MITAPRTAEHDSRAARTAVQRGLRWRGTFTVAGRATSDGCWRWARCCSSRSATSAADWKRWAGFLACSLAMRSHSHCGTSGMIWRIGRGVSSATRFSTASAVARGTAAGRSPSCTARCRG